MLARSSTARVTFAILWCGCTVFVSVRLVYPNHSAWCRPRRSEYKSYLLSRCYSIDMDLCVSEGGV
jgi:hypothetical protein